MTDILTVIDITLTCTRGPVRHILKRASDEIRTLRSENQRLRESVIEPPVPVAIQSDLNNLVQNIRKITGEIEHENLPG